MDHVKRLSAGQVELIIMNSLEVMQTKITKNEPQKSLQKLT